MLKEGRTPLPTVIHEPDVFVWSSAVIGSEIGDIRRVAYYTSVVGDDEKVLATIRRLRQQQYQCADGRLARTSNLVPIVYKKAKKEQKSRAVDINITVDALRAVTNGSAGMVRIFSGDADFVPVVEELMRLGATVAISALSSGLSPKLETCADSFALLDAKFFQPMPDSQPPQ